MASRHLEHDWYSRPLPDNVRFGARTWLYSSHAFAHYRSRAPEGLRVGNDTGIYHGTFFDLGPGGTVEIGDYCSVVGVIFATNGKITIGDYTLMAHEVVIADSYWPRPVAEEDELGSIAGATENSIAIGQNVWIGAQAVIIGSVRVGDGAIIGAGAVVTQDVPPHSLCAGNPMRIVRTLQHSHGRSADCQS